MPPTPTPPSPVPPTVVPATPALPCASPPSPPSGRVLDPARVLLFPALLEPPLPLPEGAGGRSSPPPQATAIASAANGKPNVALRIVTPAGDSCRLGANPSAWARR